MPADATAQIPERLPPTATSTAATHASPTAYVVEPAAGWPRIDFDELWQYRGLFWFMVWRDLKVRYAQTVLGAGWAIAQPLITMVVFSVVFGGLARVPSDGIPYPVFSLAALVPWMFFSQALSQASASLVSNANLLTKIYFPRLIIPFSAVLVSLADFVVAFVILLVVVLAYGIVPSAQALVVIPLLVVAVVLIATGLGSYLAALNIKYRDVRAITVFLVQAWMYASPVVYPLSLVPDRYRTLYQLNPMVGVVEGFRATLLRSTPVPWAAIGLSLGIGAFLFVAGALYFRKVEEMFADVA